MTDVAIFLTDVGATATASAGIVVYLRPHLRSILTDLCGTVERANFWAAFSNVALMLVPLIFAMDYRPEVRPGTGVILEMAAQLKHALVGLVATVAILGFVIGGFIPRSRPAPATLQGKAPV